MLDALYIAYSRQCVDALCIPYIGNKAHYMRYLMVGKKALSAETISSLFKRMRAFVRFVCLLFGDVNSPTITAWLSTNVAHWFVGPTISHRRFSCIYQHAVRPDS